VRFDKIFNDDFGLRIGDLVERNYLEQHAAPAVVFRVFNVRDTHGFVVSLFPFVLGFGFGGSLPLHIVRAVYAAALECDDMVNHVALT